MTSEGQKHKKRNRRRALDDIIRFTTSVGENTHFTGAFSGGDDFVIRGSVTGNSTVEGAVVIAEGGTWNGHITADIIVIAGNVNGNITAREKLEILSTANINGTLQSPILAMATGAVHEGQIKMREQTSVTQFDEKRRLQEDNPTS